MSRRATRVALVLVVVAVVGVGAVLGVRKLWQLARDHFVSDQCTIGAYDLDPAQAAVASTMVGAVSRYTKERLPERAAVLVLAAGLQESKLTNLSPGAGDRDSVGVLQQRPSQGWGGSGSTASRQARLNDVGEATTEFLDQLIKIDGWQSLTLADAVQHVQISADGSAYAQHEAEAKVLADALQGRRPAAISCSFAKPTKVASVAAVATQVHAQLPVQTPSTAGRTVRVPGAAWQTAAWFVANADRLGIDAVAYDGKRWTRSNGWKPATGSTAAVVATMYQL